MIKSRCVDQNKGMAGTLGVSEDEGPNLQVCGGLFIVDRCNTFICSDIDELSVKVTQAIQRGQR